MPRKSLGLFMPLYISDWRGSSFVAGLTLEEEALFLRCLMYCWEHGSLPLDDPRIHRLVGVDREGWQKGWQRVKQAFDSEGRNESLERKRTYHQARAEAGRAGGKAKGQANGQANGVAKGNPQRSESKRAEFKRPDPPAVRPTAVVKQQDPPPPGGSMTDGLL